VVDLVLSPRVFFDNQHQGKKKNRERRNENENNIIIEGEKKSRTIRLLSLLVEMLLKMMLLLLFAARRRDIRVKESFNKEIWISFVIKSALFGLYAVARARERDLVLYTRCE
jgi:hypothetical protein